MNFICVSTFRDASKRSEKKKRESLNISEHGMIKGYVQLQLEGIKKKKEREREVSWSEV